MSNNYPNIPKHLTSEAQIIACMVMEYRDLPQEELIERLSGMDKMGLRIFAIILEGHQNDADDRREQIIVDPIDGKGNAGQHVFAITKKGTVMFGEVYCMAQHHNVIHVENNVWRIER